MIDRLAGNKFIPTDIRQEIIERTDGIPLRVRHCSITNEILHAGYMPTLRIDLACILRGMQGQPHAQDYLVRRFCRSVCPDWYRHMALHQNIGSDGRTGWLAFQSINRHYGCEGFAYFAPSL
jgi:hypothetical protein